jgi:RHS repeat-associated protein
VLFASREFDFETGLYYNRARYLDPTTGRWTSLDPIGYEAGDVNLYRYVQNIPTLFTDPLGLEWVYPWDPQADWSDWRIGEALGDAWKAIAGGVGGGITGGGIGAGCGALGAGTVVVIVAVATATPLGWAAGAVVLTGAVAGGVYGAVHGVNMGQHEDNFIDGATAVASDPGSYIVPYFIGTTVGARMYKVTLDGPYVDCPPLLE